MDNEQLNHWHVIAKYMKARVCNAWAGEHYVFFEKEFIDEIDVILGIKEEDDEDSPILKKRKKDQIQKLIQEESYH